MAAFHNSRAAQTAQCRMEAEQGHEGYLSHNNRECVFGRAIPRSQGQNFQCCQVDRDSNHIATARAILNFADQHQDAGTQQLRASLTSLLVNAGVGGLPFFVNNSLRKLMTTERKHKEMMDLLDKIVPISSYEVEATIDKILALPVSRRAKQNITYNLVTEDSNFQITPPVSAIDARSDILNLATNVHVYFDQSTMSRARLEVFIINAIRHQSDARNIELYLRSPGLDGDFLDLMECTLRVESSFRGSIKIISQVPHGFPQTNMRLWTTHDSTFPANYSIEYGPNQIHMTAIDL